jgi:hypothetical protein
MHDRVITFFNSSGGVERKIYDFMDECWLEACDGLFKVGLEFEVGMGIPCLFLIMLCLFLDKRRGIGIFADQLPSLDHVSVCVGG